MHMDFHNFESFPYYWYGNYTSSAFFSFHIRKSCRTTRMHTSVFGRDALADTVSIRRFEMLWKQLKIRQPCTRFLLIYNLSNSSVMVQQKPTNSDGDYVHHWLAVMHLTCINILHELLNMWQTNCSERCQKALFLLHVCHTNPVMYTLSSLKDCTVRKLRSS